MSWKVSLDRYLTEPPDDGFDNWSEKVINSFSEDFYNKNEDWIMDNTNKNQCNIWFNELFRRGIAPQETVLIIERAFKLFC